MNERRLLSIIPLLLVCIAVFVFVQFEILISTSTKSTDDGSHFKLDFDDDAVSDDTAKKKIQNAKETKSKEEALSHVVPVGATSTSAGGMEKGEGDKDAKKEADKDSAGEETETKEKKMNILVFYADDWRFDSLGSLNPIVHTPNLDKLTKQGMIFTQNAVTTSICWISRATLATGQHYARHKTLNLSEPIPFYDYWEDTVFARLKKGGYFTAAVGKWQPGNLKPHFFDFSTNYWGFHLEGDEHITDMNERDALEFLVNKRKGRTEDPFALFVNFFAPHHHDGQPEQYFPQNKTKHLYQDVEVPFAPTCTEEAWRKLPPFFSDINEGRARWRLRFDEPKKAQKMIKNYYRLISGVDMTIGKILEEVERQGLMNNTMILFTTDNGYYHAEHGLADKFYAHQESVRVPLIIKDPRMNKDLIGTKNEELTLSIDLAPTLLQVGNLDIPDRMQGVDMSPLYTGTKKDTETIKTEWRKGFYYEYPGIYRNIAHIPVQALVRKDHKYIYWPTKNYEELFHLPSDQYEEHDLARNPTSEIKTLLEKLRAEFKKVQSEAQ